MLFIPMLFISGIVAMKETVAHAMTPDGQLGPRSLTQEDLATSQTAPLLFHCYSLPRSIFTF